MKEPVAYISRNGELAWYRLWTDEEKARLRALFEAGHDDVRIGKALGRTAGAVCHVRLDLGLRRGGPFVGPWTPELRAEAVNLRRAGKSSSQIARYLGHGLTRNAVIAELWRMSEPGRRINQTA